MVENALLQQALGGMQEAAPALMHRCVAFVATGAQPEVLLELPRLGPLLGERRHVHWRSNFTVPDASRRDATEACQVARHTLYTQVVNDADTVAMLVRLGKVLAAVGDNQHLQRTDLDVPYWLQHLLNDAFWVAYFDAEPELDQAPCEQQERATLAARPAWDSTLLAALLAHEHCDPALLLPFIFERSRGYRDRQDRLYRRLLAPGALDAYLLTHLQEVRAAAGVLSAPGRVLLLDRLGADPALLAANAELVTTLAAGSGYLVEEAAARHLAAIDSDVKMRWLGQLLRTGSNAERTNAAGLLADIPGTGAIAVLEAALAGKATKPVQQAIQAALARLRIADSDLDLPKPPPLPEAPPDVLAEDAVALLLASRDELQELLRIDAEQEIAENRTAAQPDDYWQKRYAECKALDADTLWKVVGMLNGDTATPPAFFRNASLIETLHYDDDLLALPGFGLLQVLRLLNITELRGSTWRHPTFQAWLRCQEAGQVDLRELAALAESFGARPDGLLREGLCQRWDNPPLPHMLLPADQVWPAYAARPELIEEGLGLVPATNTDKLPLDAACTLAVLATFPAMPARWLPRVLEMALADAKACRPAAQHALARVPGIGTHICAALASASQEVRIEAARWLARRGDQDGVPALNAALAKESRETVSAVMLAALEQLGADMTPHLAPATLLAQARTALKAKIPAALAWVVLDALLACTWNDGTAVEPDVLRWWVLLAAKLKEPGGNPLLARYLDLLAPASRAALGRAVLHQFIERERTGESAIGAKGMLALVWAMPGAELAGAIATFMREHHTRRAQIEALLEAASVSDQPAVIQFLLGIARRYRTPSVQELAITLMERIADRNGWTAGQLAERTVPTGGLDDSGQMLLQYGNRTFTVTLDAAMKPVLHSAGGAVVAALPAPRQGDSPEEIKEAKRQLANCKKEIKQVIDQQGVRLYEAMCVGHAWPAADWRDYLLLHPVVGRLVQRLVWIDDADRTFRPSEDGSLIDVHDTEVTIADGATIRLAHAALLPVPEATAWLAHFKDYKVAPLFVQMARPVTVPFASGDDAISDRLGWFSDTFTLRTAFKKRGYERSAPDEGTLFFSYCKPFSSAGLTVIIDFSGSTVPEDNYPAALKTLSFREGYRTIALDQVPPVLLAEAWADYHAVAAACAGFDAQWEKKIPW